MKIEAFFLDRDGVVIEDVNLLHKINQIKLIPRAAEAIRLINETGIKAIVITNQTVIARGLCTYNQVERINKYIEKRILKESGGYFDAIFFCPHHPNINDKKSKLEYIIECNCRKPKIGMLIQAKHMFNLDLNNCIFIGDRTIDIQTGENAGCKTVLVSTGEDGSDRKFEVTPDYHFQDLYSAVNFFLSKYKTNL